MRQGEKDGRHLSSATRIPFAALFAPVAAAMLTALAGVVANVFRQGPRGG